MAGPAPVPLAHIPNALLFFLPPLALGQHYGVQYIFASVNYLVTFVGIAASANVFWRLYHGDEEKACSVSLFTEPLGYNADGEPVGCIATLVGLAVLAAHLAIDCLFGAVSVLLTVASYKNQSLPSFLYHDCILLYLLLLPVLTAAVLVWMAALALRLVDRATEENRQTLVVIGGLGEAGLSPARAQLRHLWHRLQVLEVFLENVTEALISIWLFHVGYDSLTTLGFFSPFLVNLTYRIFYYLVKHCTGWYTDLWTAY